MLLLWRSKARSGCALTIPTGHQIKSKAVFSAVDSILYFELWSLSHWILINHSCLFSSSKGNICEKIFCLLLLLPTELKKKEAVSMVFTGVHDCSAILAILSTAMWTYIPVSFLTLITIVTSSNLINILSRPLFFPPPYFLCLCHSHSHDKLIH